MQGRDGQTGGSSVQGERLLERIVAREVRLAVLGQGYVGLTLACEAAEAGFPTVGIDVDEGRIAGLVDGTAEVPGVDGALVRSASASGGLTFSADPSAIRDADLIFICVPTPLRDHQPDLSYIEAACADVAKHLRPGSLVVLESTTYPGTTEDLIRDRLETGGRRHGEDFLLAYSAERIDPGNAEFGFRNTPKIVAGVTPEATEAAVAFYEQLVDKVVPVSSPRVAETAKLFENTFRHVNIALANEMAILCRELDIDVWEVVDAASTKPFGFMPFYPGPGIGGHCIPLDPTYLAWKIGQDSGRRFGLLDLAKEINARMPDYVASRALEILNQTGRAMKGASVLVLGVTYKPDVGDARETPAIPTMRALAKHGADVRFHDPFVDRISVNGSELYRQDLDAAVPEADLVVLLTPHSEYDLERLAASARIVFDTRNAYGGRRPANVVAL